MISGEKRLDRAIVSWRGPRYSGPPTASLIVSLCASLLCMATSVPAQDITPLPDPLGIEDVATYARLNRQEIAAARARARAADQRPAIVSALDDPMIMPSVDHLPFMLNGADVSLMVEQRFPLSGIRGHQRQAAEADARRISAEAERVAQDVQVDAVKAFLMLHERREMARILGQQVKLARQFVDATAARYSTSTGTQTDVLRAEIEVARLDSAIRASRSEIAAAETMLNVGLGRPSDAAVPSLMPPQLDIEPPDWAEVREVALNRRPELAAGRAGLSQAQADISVMKSMYKPMGFVRTGPSYTMSDGKGWMITAGISIPLWREKLDAGVRQASAMHDMARADLDAMTRMIEGDVTAALRQVAAARERVLALRDEVVPRARQAIDPSVAAYTAGTVPLISVLDAAQVLWAIEADLVSAQYELGLAWARLRRAQGIFDEGAGP